MQFLLFWAFCRSSFFLYFTHSLMSFLFRKLQLVPSLVVECMWDTGCVFISLDLCFHSGTSTVFMDGVWIYLAQCSDHFRTTRHKDPGQYFKGQGQSLEFDFITLHYCVSLFLCQPCNYIVWLCLDGIWNYLRKIITT